MMRLALAATLLLASAGSALAQPVHHKAAPAHRAPPAAPAKPVKSYDFLADQIDGDRVMPDGTTVFGLPDAKRPSLIRLRGDFVREIVRSAEKL